MQGCRRCVNFELRYGICRAVSRMATNTWKIGLHYQFSYKYDKYYNYKNVYNYVIKNIFIFKSEINYYEFNCVLYLPKGCE